MEFEALVRRVRGEFLEMPGLSLTIPQAQRLWGLREDVCRKVVETLVVRDFLRYTRDGTIARTDD
jgi:hypothetical protein